MKRLRRHLLGFVFLVLFTIPCFSQSTQWSVEKANAWYAEQPWLVGCNFLPSTAINQIEMWQVSTWDPETIERELGWAEELGFNTLRVYLHDVVYMHEGKDYLRRIHEFLRICNRHSIRPILVFFDDCHWALPEYGKQPDPIPGVHNSGWKQSPGWHITRAYEEGTIPIEEQMRLEKYVKDVLREFANDNRVLAWDLYNESGQGQNVSHKLLADTWEWAWEIRPSQPLTACVNGSVGEYVRKLNAKNSDIYSFHAYSKPGSFEKVVEASIKAADGRPVICTEYMARTNDNTFQYCMPIFKEKKIGCWNWGFVDGKSGTKWAWSSRKREEGGQASPTPTSDPATAPDDPPLWFHDILRSDGRAYSNEEIEFIRSILGGKL